jgi:hypothetical protein
VQRGGGARAATAAGGAARGVSARHVCLPRLAALGQQRPGARHRAGVVRWLLCICARSRAARSEGEGATAAACCSVRVGCAGVCHWPASTPLCVCCLCPLPRARTHSTSTRGSC